jgi:hypothetical protein
MVYLGGAVLSDIMKDKNEFWITKQEWEEEGGKLVLISIFFLKLSFDNFSFFSINNL